MSDNAKVLKDHLGTPLAWLKDSKGEILLDVLGGPLSRFITGFKYIYDEENDDECNIKFQFPNSEHCDNIMLSKDAVIKVQWGYNTNESGVIKSPERTIAIRDKKIQYKEDGIEMELECTDLISYTKNVKTNTVKNNTNYFVDWLKEISEGKFKATITTHGFKTLIEKDGTMKNFEFDEKLNVVKQKAVDNARFETRTQKLNFSKVIKGKSLSINNAIKDLLPDISEGPYLLDSTDDTMEIRPRNFNQDTFKTFTYKGGHGELLTFKSKSDTRKVKEDSSTTAKIDPKKKEINDTEVNVADTSIAATIARNTQTQNHKPNQAEIDQWLSTANLFYEHNVKHPLDQRDIPPLTYKRTVAELDNYMAQTVIVKKPVIYTLSAKDILNDPELEANISSNRLTNRAIERLQIKYEADAKIIGDPSMIKAKIYEFNNLAKSDNGKWYAIKVAHTIESGSYFTELDLIKKPEPIHISDNSNNKKINYDTDSEELTFEDEITNKDSEVYPSPDKETLNDDEVQTNNRSSTSNKSESTNIKDRVNQLDAENDYVGNNNEENGYNLSDEDYKVNISGIPSYRESNYEDLNKPNNERF